MKKYLSHVLVTSTILAFCTLTTIVLYAALETERNTVKEKQAALAELKQAIIDLRARTKDAFATLKEQRALLRDKIKTARADFTTNRNTMRSKLQTIKQELNSAIDKFKAAATSDPEKKEAKAFEDQAKTNFDTTNKSIDDFTTIEQPLEI